MTTTRVFSVLALVLGSACSDEKELKTCRDERAGAVSEASKLRVKLESRQRELSALRQQLEDLGETADGAWARLQAGDAGDVNALELERFISKFPQDSRTSSVRARLKSIQDQRRVEEAETALASVRVQQILADPGSYRGKSFRRVMCCNGLESGILPCSWAWTEGGVAVINSRVDVRLSRELAKRVVASAGHLEFGTCAFQFTGRLLFAGEIDRWKPVMVLQSADFEPVVDPMPE